MASSNKSTMEKTNQHDHPPPPPLKCPRCDSSNTKFCYYNNYSLSQPRHFCKACKRYWTRGGTLRNVPVGGGCRKNKRVKRHPAAPAPSPSSSTAAASTTLHQQIDLSPTPPPSNNPLFYGLPTNPLDPNFPFSRFGSGRVSSTGLDLVPQMNGVLGLGFSSSGGLMAASSSSSSHMLTSAGSGSNLNPIFFGSSNNDFSPSSTMASLLASSFQHQKFMLKDVQTSNSSFSGLMAGYDQDHMQMNGGDEAMVKDGRHQEEMMKMGGGENNYSWNGGHNGFHNQQIINTVSDSSSILWNTNNNIGAWLDPSNMGSSVPSLI